VAGGLHNKVRLECEQALELAHDREATRTFPFKLGNPLRSTEKPDKRVCFRSRFETADDLVTDCAETDDREPLQGPLSGGHGSHDMKH